MNRGKQLPKRVAKPLRRGNSGGHGEPASNSFPIVGVGASAGRLEAVEKLLKHLPANTGMAFLVVQHLDPKHESRLTEILSHATSMPVTEVTDRTVVTPNHVYIIPPNSTMFLRDGLLRLEPRKGREVHHVPVDSLFQSLARVRKSRAIGVILSGTASDGVAGMRAIKEEGGITFAQDAGSAKYFGMPQSSIIAGVVDFVLPPEEIAKRLARIGQHRHLRMADLQDEEQASARPGREKPLSELFRLLKKNYGVDLTTYKFSTVDRRIKRRMALHGTGDLKKYLRLIRNQPEELRELYRDMFIGVTYIFDIGLGIPAIRMGKFWRFRKTDLNAWIQSEVKYSRYAYRPFAEEQL